jgi:hypothetical protein
LQEYNIYNGINGGSTHRELPVQTLPKSKKNKHWLQACADALYFEATRQRRKNAVFSDIRKMTEGEFVYRAVDIERTLNNTDVQQLQALQSDVAIPTNLKHFDFLGIIANAIKGVFGETDSQYTVDSNDDYYTNDFIRAKTEKLNQYAKAVFKREIDRMLIERGIDPDQQSFNSEEEKQQYIAQLDAEVKKLTPEEIEKDLSKNFKVIATEWAANVLTSDKKKFHLEEADKNALVDYILTGRWFRHYRIGFDYYDIEDWQVEEVFFSEYANTKYPQDCSYVGRITEYSITDVISKYGHLMTSKQQEETGDFWGQGTDYESGIMPLSGDGKLPFAENLIMPFHNYLDHNVNLQMESALGAPIGYTKNEDGTVTNSWMPRAANDLNRSSSGLTQQLRTDITISNSAIEVMEAYWTSMERYGVIIFENEVGSIDIETVTEELVKDFLIENNIKLKKSLSLQELQDALKIGNLTDYANTITWHYKPQSWYMVVLKSNNSLTIKDDIILWGKPIEQQIKGDSNIFQVRHPVGGIITKSAITKAFPYQQLHNICLNQISELLADEPGTFFSLDINTLPAEYKDETTEEALYSIMNTIKTTKLLPLDPSRSNIQGSSVYPNIFQRNEIVFASQVQYRREMAEYFKAQGMQQVGVTPQMLAAPTTYETAEGVSQQATASYALMSNYIDEFNTSKSKSNELHIAIAQICEVNGKTSNRLIKNSDGSNHFIDILAEDPEYFPLRRISVMPIPTSKDRAIAKALQQMLLADNTIQKDFGDLVDIFTNPYALKLKQIGKDIRARTEQQQAQQRQFEDSQTTKVIEAKTADREDLQQHEVNLANIKGEWQYKEAYLTAIGRDSASTKDDNMADITKAFENNLKVQQYQTDLAFRGEELQRKMDMDSTSKAIELEKIKQKNAEMQQRYDLKQIDYNIAVQNKN